MAEGRGRLAAAACAALLATSWATTCATISAAEERRSVTAGGLVGTLSFEDAAGQPVAVPPPGRSLRLVLALEDAVTGEASRGLRPAAWIRAVEPGGGDCAAAGRAFRATGRLPLGTIDLNGIVMAASFADGAVTLVDPRLDLATANLRAAHAFGAPPAFILGLREAQAFLLGFASPGRLVALDAADGSIRDLAGVARPTAAAPAGAGTVFVADAGDGSLVLADLAGGPPRARWPLGPDPRLSAGPGGRAVAWSPAGSLLLMSPSADPALRLDRPRLDGAALVPEPPAPSAPPAAAAVALLDGPSLEVVWLDAPGQSTVINLGAAADLLLAAPDGRLVFAIGRSHRVRNGPMRAARKDPGASRIEREFSNGAIEWVIYAKPSFGGSTPCSRTRQRPSSRSGPDRKTSREADFDPATDDFQNSAASECVRCSGGRDTDLDLKVEVA